MTGQCQDCVSMMLLTLLSWPQEGCHSTNQQVSPHRSQEDRQGSSPSASVSFLHEHTSFLKKPRPKHTSFVSVVWLVLTPHSPVILFKNSHPYHVFMVGMLTLDLGFGLTVCSSQWIVRGCGVSGSLKCAFTTGLALWSLCNPPWEEHTPGSL